MLGSPLVTLDELRESRRQFDHATERPGAAQWELLQSLLRSRAATEIGRRYRFDTIDSLDEYRRRVPVMTYDDLAEYHARMANGEADVLFPGRAWYVARTSGTTSGKPKDIAFPSDYRAELLSALGPFLVALEDAHPGCLRAGVALTGMFHDSVTSAGIAIGQASAAGRRVMSGLGLMEWAPEPVFEEKGFEARYYALLFYALARPVKLLMSFSAPQMITLFEKATAFAKPLADDLEDGTFSRGPGTERLRAELVRLAALPGPRPDAAARLRRIVDTHGRFLPREMWPELELLCTWKGGPARHYLQTLNEQCPGLEIWPMIPSSAESIMMAPLEPSLRGGVPVIRTTVFEFYPATLAPEPQNFVPIEELQEGVGYRALRTAARGLFRYASDDVFLVEGRYRNTPVLYFSHRDRAVSIIDEKFCEADVVRAIEEAGGEHVRLTEYQLAPARFGTESAYALLVEFAADPPSDAELRELVQRFQASLCQNNIYFPGYLKNGLVGSTRLVVLPTGSFEQLRQSKVDGQGSDAHHKVLPIRSEYIDLEQLSPLCVVSSG